MTQPFALSPEERAAGAAAARRDYIARRERVDPAEVARLRAAYEAGASEVAAMEPVVAAVAEFAHHGVTMTAVEAFRGTLVGAAGEGQTWANGAAAAHGSTWRAILEAAYQVGTPVDDARDRGAPSIDLDRVFAGCPTVAAQCREVARELKISTDLPALAALAIASAAMCNRVDGVIARGDGRGEWAFPLALMLAPEVGSGDGKSATLVLMGDGVLADFEREIVAQAEGKVRAAKRARELLEQERNRLNGERQRKDPPTPERCAEIEARIAAIDAEREKPLPSLPLFRAGDITPEKFDIKGGAVGFVFIRGGEGQKVLRHFSATQEGGRFDKFDSLLSAYTREETIRERCADGDNRTRFSEFAASAFLPLQPGILVPRTSEEARLLESFATRGVFARVLVARPREFTKAETIAMPGPSAAWATTQKRYNAMVGALCRWHGEEDPVAPARRVRLTWAPDATAAANTFRNDWKADGRCGGSMYDSLGRAEFAKRAGENLARLACVLRALRWAEGVTGGEEPGEHVEVELCDFEAARCLFEDYLVPNALAVFARATFDPIGDDADRVLAVMCERGSCLRSDLQARLGRGWGKLKPSDRLSRLDAALEVLEERGLVVIERQKGRGGGQRIRLVTALAAPLSARH